MDDMAQPVEILHPEGVQIIVLAPVEKAQGVGVYLQAQRVLQKLHVQPEDPLDGVPGQVEPPLPGQVAVGQKQVAAVGLHVLLARLPAPRHARQLQTKALPVGVGLQLQVEEAAQGVRRQIHRVLHPIALVGKQPVKIHPHVLQRRCGGGGGETGGVDGGGALLRRLPGPLGAAAQMQAQGKQQRCCEQAEPGPHAWARRAFRAWAS